MEPFGIALPQDVAGRKIFVKHLTLMQCGCKMAYGSTKLLILSFLCIAHLIELMWIVDLYGYEKRKTQQSDGVALLNKGYHVGGADAALTQDVGIFHGTLSFWLAQASGIDQQVCPKRAAKAFDIEDHAIGGNERFYEVMATVYDRSSLFKLLWHALGKSLVACIARIYRCLYFHLLFVSFAVSLFVFILDFWAFTLFAFSL